MILLATDLDGTLVGDRQATEKLLHDLRKRRQSGELKLVYATGRSLERYRGLQDSEKLDHPDALIAAVGTEIYIGDAHKPLLDWSAVFDQNWDREAIVHICLQTSLNLQQPSEQRPYKISFETDAPNESEISKLRNKLHHLFPGTDILVSHSGQYVDIVPSGSDKGRAVQYLANLWGANTIIAAGDSSNDIAMLAVSKAIVTGNAYEEVKEWYADHPGAEVYFAQASFASGISEGLKHYLGS